MLAFMHGKSAATGDVMRNLPALGMLSYKRILSRTSLAFVKSCCVFCTPCFLNIASCSSPSHRCPPSSPICVSSSEHPYPFECGVPVTFSLMSAPSRGLHTLRQFVHAAIRSICGLWSGASRNVYHISLRKRPYSVRSAAASSSPAPTNLLVGAGAILITKTAMQTHGRKHPYLPSVLLDRAHGHSSGLIPFKR